MANTSETCYYITSVAICAFVLGNLSFILCSIVDYNGGIITHDPVTGVANGTKQMIGTSIYYTFVLSYQFVCLAFITVCSYLHQRCAIGKESQASVSWPLFKLNMSCFLKDIFIPWAILLGLYTTFMVRYHWGSNVNMAPGTFHSAKVDIFQFNTIFSIIVFFYQFTAALDMMYVYIIGIYKPEPVEVSQNVAEALASAGEGSNPLLAAHEQ